MARAFRLCLLVLLAGCGDDDDDDTAGGPDAGRDAAPEEDAGGGLDAGTDSGPAPDECPPPPDDLPEDVTITEDERYYYLDVFDTDELEPRSVTVVVPEGYEAGDERYPVVYLMDGSLAVGMWRADRTLDELTAEGAIPPHILVAVNSSKQRGWELTPDEDPDLPEAMQVIFDPERPFGGGGPHFAALVVDVIKPFVDAHFRTRCGRENTTIGGFSLGGLMCAYFLRSHPDVFGRGLCESASYWWHEGAEATSWEDFAGPMPVRLWLGVGTAEARDEDPETFGLTFGMVSRARDMRQLAVAKGMVLGQDLGYYEQPDALHDFGVASERLPIALEFLLSDLTVSPDDADSLALHLFETDLAAPARGDWMDQCDLSVNLGWGARTRMTWPNADAVLSSTAPEIATVDESGLVTAVAEGAATIEGELAGLTAADDVEVH